MCVTLVSLVHLSFLSLLSLLYESLPPQLSETPHQPKNQRTGARGGYAPRRYEVRRSQSLLIGTSAEIYSLLAIIPLFQRKAIVSFSII